MLDKTNPTNIEILRIAKDLAYSDYNNRKAELHNQWLKESDYMWRTQKLRVAYPTIPPYPTEEEIVSRAKKLLDFLNTPRPDLELPQTSAMAPEFMQASDAPVSQNNIDGENNSGIIPSVFKNIKNVWK